MSMPLLFWKKYGAKIPPDKTPHQTLTFRMHLVLVYLMRIGTVLNPTILLVHIAINRKVGLVAKYDTFQLLQSPIREHTALPMVGYL